MLRLPSPQRKPDHQIDTLIISALRYKDISLASLVGLHHVKVLERLRENFLHTPHQSYYCSSGHTTHRCSMYLTLSSLPKAGR